MTEQEIERALIEKLGGDSIDEMKSRFATLPQARLSDLHVEARARIFWPEAN